MPGEAVERESGIKLVELDDSSVAEFYGKAFVKRALEKLFSALVLKLFDHEIKRPNQATRLKQKVTNISNNPGPAVSTTHILWHSRTQSTESDSDKSAPQALKPTLLRRFSWPPRRHGDIPRQHS